jgi:hypothetical protein
MHWIPETSIAQEIQSAAKSYQKVIKNPLFPIY